MRILSASETRQALPMKDAIGAMTLAFGPDTHTPLRQAVGPSLVMPGRVGESIAVKVVSTVPGHPSGIVAAFDSVGEPIGIVDGPTITAIRTAAGAGLVTDMLSPADASSMAMIGAGAMARDQILAMLEVRSIEQVVVWSRNPANAEGLAEEFNGRVASSPKDAVASVDIVTTATPATVPLFAADDLPDRVHVNAIGAFLPSMVEIPPDYVRDAFVVVDDLEAAATEAGDLIQAGREPDTTISALLSMAEWPIRHRTLFKSVGVATQDVAAAVAVLDNAERMGIGTVV